ncbi:MAG TPA: hypothetical protein VK937_07205 [Candidatus Limnocylindria bacterium]|nr:hypothetical protein [Candidatus Limnocylindria bacterium]
MRLLAVAIAAAFACGIVLGLHPTVARNAASLLLLSSSFVTIAVLVLRVPELVVRNRLANPNHRNSSRASTAAIARRD